jgi:hypothetical protein
MIAEIGDPSLAILDGAVTGTDAIEILGSRSRKTAKRIIERIDRKRRAGRINPGANFPGSAIRAKLPRPSRKLQRRNCSSVDRLPGLPVPGPTAFLGQEEALGRAVALLIEGAHPQRVLQFACRSNAVGLPVADCAGLLFEARAVPTRFSEIEIKAVERAEFLASRLEDARAIYSVMASAGDIPRAVGEWGYFADPELLLALDGIRIPRALRRAEYLVRIFRNSCGEPECFDFHSIRGLPLFRHPL